jgi:hypothetical protein
VRLQTVWLWWIGYFAAVALAAWAMLEVRGQLVEGLDTDQARQHWQNWREHAQDSGPVARRLPVSPEPPTVVLLRDHFGVCLAAVLIGVSLLYGVLALMLRGALRPARIDLAADEAS